MVDEVAVYDDARAAVHIEAVGAAVAAVGGVGRGADVVDLVAGNQTVARLIRKQDVRNLLEADSVYTDIVIVMDEIIRDLEVLDVAVEGHGLLEPVIR